jgi:hypothetical protein
MARVINKVFSSYLTLSSRSFVQIQPAFVETDYYLFALLCMHFALRASAGREHQCHWVIDQLGQGEEHELRQYH